MKKVRKSIMIKILKNLVIKGADLIKKEKILLRWNLSIKEI